MKKDGARIELIHGRVFPRIGPTGRATRTM
jgi:hypothetical protein